MRNLALVLFALAACGGGGDNDKKDGGTVFEDAKPAHDAPPLIACTPVNGTNVKVRQVGRVNGAAMLAISPPNDGRLFVLENAGRLRIFENEQLKAAPFLDVTTAPDFEGGGEQGLLGVAFHPNYANNRTFYVYYTTGPCPGAKCANVVARYTQSASNPDVADTTGEVILRIPDFATNHNGGMMEFGSDGYLYISTGDGGGGGDPCRNGVALDRTASSCSNPPASCGQNGGTTCEPLLGKILRIDVNTTTGNKKYGIPASNPYATSGGEPEIFISGLRNPWRWTFDTMTGDMWIADVGQDVDEEITVLKPNQQPGANLGWSMYEASRCYGNYTCSTAGQTFPQVTRNQNDGWEAIIGGQVYRGSCFPDLQGTYFFTDNTLHPLQTAKLESNGTVTTANLAPPMGGWPTGPASIHADARGELFLTTITGYVYQIEAGP